MCHLIHVKKMGFTTSKKNQQCLSGLIYLCNNLKFRNIIWEYIDEEGYSYRLNAKYLSYDTKQNLFYKKTDITRDDIFADEFMFGTVIVASKYNPLTQLAKFAL